MKIERSIDLYNFNKILSSVDSGERNRADESLNDSVSITGSPAKKELTILFYMHGQYKDLHRTTASTFFQLEQAGSDENTNIIAQLGRAPQDESDKEPQNIDGDWSGVRRYYVTKTDHSDLSMTLEQWIEVKEKIPNNPIVHYVLGDIYWNMGEKEKAKTEYAKAKELGMLDYMNNYDSPSSKKIRDEFDATTKPYEDAYKDKQIFGSPVVEILPSETKMGDPDTLKDFIAWGMKNYPAKHYVLVVTGHGGAWIGALEMSPSKMGQAIKEGVALAEEETGESKKLDAVVFNSCYMANTEAVYEMRKAADINISSENYSRGNMLYDWSDHIERIQKDIREKGEFDPKAFAKDFVEYYRREGSQIKENFPEFARWKESYLTLTAIDNKHMDQIVAAWKDFVEACRENKVPDHLIFSAFAKSQGYNSNAFNPAGTIFAFYDMIKDLGDIMRLVCENPAIPEDVKKKAKEVERAIGEAIIAEQHEGLNMNNSTGLTIWAPSNAVDIAFMANRYEHEDVPEFVKASGFYLDFLKSAAKEADQEALKAFMADVGLIRSIRQILNDPSYKLTEEERKNLEEAKEIITQDALKIKKKLDLTIPKIKTMGSIDIALKSKPDYIQYGNIAKDLIKDIATKDGLTDERLI